MFRLLKKENAMKTANFGRAMIAILLAASAAPVGAQQNRTEARVWQTKTKGTMAHLEESAFELRRKDAVVATVPLAEIDEIRVTTKGNRPVWGLMEKWTRNGLEASSVGGQGAGLAVAAVAAGAVALAPFTLIRALVQALRARVSQLQADSQHANAL
jgi:hypothetical protein